MKFLILCWVLLSSFHMNAQQTEEQFGKITLVVHGGAGTITRENMTPEKEKAYTEKLQEALNVGYEILQNGGTSVEAIVASIEILENSPLFNAGKGAVFTNEGRNELDASIMEGQEKQAGAVAGVTTIKNPIMAALAVMKNSPHVMMTGTGAENFARMQGLEIVSPEYFHTEERFKQLEKINKTNKIKLDHSGEGSLKNTTPDSKFGTVGALALDQYGNLAAGTSTGGMTNKKYGRVGDSPIIGAGTYADNETCAVSGTGHGEYFIRMAVAYDITALMKYKGLTVEEAAEEVILKKLAKIGGDGGVIALDRKGNIAMPFNTAGMYRGYIQREKDPKVFIYKD